MNNKAIIYARVSSNRQKQEGNGLSSQIHTCKNYAKNHNLEVLKTFQDDASGDSSKRSGLAEAFEYIKNNPKVSFFIVDDMSRLARDVALYFTLKDQLDEVNVTLKMTNQEFDDSSSGRMLEQIQATIKEYERNDNRERVIRRMRARIEQGYWPHCAPPGYKNVTGPDKKKYLVIDEQTGGLIRKAFEGYANGKFPTLKAVAKFLNRNNFKTKWTKKKIHPSQVDRLLRRKFYAGIIESKSWGVKNIEGKHVALISLDLFKKVQQKLNGASPTKARKDIHADFPLRGLIVCSTCKNHMTANWSTGRSSKYPYYRCSTKGCLTKSVAKKKVEKQFKRAISEAEISSKVVQIFELVTKDVWQRKKKDINADKKLAQKSIDRLRAELDAELDAYTKASSTTIRKHLEKRADELEKKIKKAEEEKTQIEKQFIDLETALYRVCQFLKNPHREWEKSPIEQKQVITRLVFKGPLEFNKVSGFETVEKSLLFTVCKDFEKKNYRLVEMAGVEPASKKEEKNRLLL